MSKQHVRVKLIAVLAGAALFLAACSSSGDNDGLAPLESSATSTETSTTTTVTTTTTTEATTTTAEPTTTIQPELDPANWDSDLDEIFGRYLLYWQALDAAYAEADPESSALADLIGSAALVDVQADIEQNYLSTGHVLVISDDSAEEHVLRLPRPMALDKTEGNEVIIQDCWVADRTKQTSDGGVVETWSFPTVFNATMKVIDGHWRVFASVTAADGSDGWDECNEYFANLDS